MKQAFTTRYKVMKTYSYSPDITIEYRKYDFVYTVWLKKVGFVGYKFESAGTRSKANSVEDCFERACAFLDTNNPFVERVCVPSGLPSPVRIVEEKR